MITQALLVDDSRSALGLLKHLIEAKRTVQAAALAARLHISRAKDISHRPMTRSYKEATTDMRSIRDPSTRRCSVFCGAHRCRRSCARNFRRDGRCGLRRAAQTCKSERSRQAGEVSALAKSRCHQVRHGACRYGEA